MYVCMYQTESKTERETYVLGEKKWRMRSRAVPSGRPSGTDGTDHPYRMTIDDSEQMKFLLQIECMYVCVRGSISGCHNQFCTCFPYRVQESCPEETSLTEACISPGTLPLPLSLPLIQYFHVKKHRFSSSTFYAIVCAMR